MGVSRVSVREALKSLATAGFVEIRQGGGCYVRSLVSDKLRDPLSLMIKENNERIFDLLEVRKEIEASSAYHAARRATESDIASLAQIIDEMNRYSETTQTPPHKLDADFHLAISQASHNAIQSHLMFTIYDLFSEYFIFLTERICFNRKYLEKIHSQHCEIFEAIKQRSPDAARQSTTEHLNFVEAELKNLFTSLSLSKHQ